MILDAKYNLFYMWIINPIENRRGNQDWTIQRKPKGQSRLDNSEKTEGAFKIGQFKENRRGNQDWTIQGHWQHWALKTHDEDFQNKQNKAKQSETNYITLQKSTKRSNTDPTTNCR
jgi:hypothetical protein